MAGLKGIFTRKALVSALSVGVALTVGVMTGGFGVTTSEAASITCNGKVATIVGTNGADWLVGTSGNDVIAGLGGDDMIFGNGGNDTICGGYGNDSIFGNGGDDVLFGDNGDDNLFGEGGNDTLSGGSGQNVLDGGDGFNQYMDENGEPYFPNAPVIQQDELSSDEIEQAIKDADLLQQQIKDEAQIIPMLFEQQQKEAEQQSQLFWKSMATVNVSTTFVLH